MRRAQRLRLWTVSLGLLCASLGLGRVPAGAEIASAPSLLISQLKITSSNGQFVTLYNASASALDLSKYQLEYFNNYDLSKATSSRLIALSGVVPPHGYAMVNDSALLLCFQLTVNSVSLGFSSTAGMVEVLAFNQGNVGGSVVPTLQDYVGWTKTAASGAQTLPTSTSAWLQRQPVDSQSNPSASSPGAGSWLAVQADSTNPCSVVSATGTGATVQTGLSQLLPSIEPPVTIINDAGQVVSGLALPSSDIGLMAPELTELLPNPAGTGNDATDEFIELYNPNGVVFDLSGFSLESGTTSIHTFTFPSGTLLLPNSFTVFRQDVTKLTLSNTSGQVKLLDPFGSSISATDAYANAADGVAWARAIGILKWSTTPSPGASNIIHEPPAKKTSSKASSSKSKGKTSSTKGKVKGAKTTAAKLPATKVADTASVSPVHPATLALVGGLALLYGAYEYRADLAHRVQKLRRNFGARRGDRL